MALKDGKQIGLEKTADVATKWIGSTASLIVHTAIFVASFALSFLGIVHFQPMLLVLTTLVSLEAIYLSIFIQMTINRNSQVIQEDVGEIQEDIEEIEEDIDEIQKDVDEIQDDSQNDQVVEKKESEALANIQALLLTLHKEIEALKKK